MENPDYYNPAYNTKYGVYSPNCGLDNVMMSWGHDDYMYLVFLLPLLSIRVLNVVILKLR